MPYHVKLPSFEGPLDLLLHLIRVQEIDIHDIPIARVTAQYLAYLELMQTLNLDVASEWLVMAATLTYIKSRMLLPRPPEDEDIEEEEDPRRELVEKLLEYQRVKVVAEELRERELEHREVYCRPPLDTPEDEEIMLDVTLFDLLDAFTSLAERLPDAEAQDLVITEMSVTEMIHNVVERMEGKGPIAFEALFEGAINRGEIVVTFLAVLEMIRLKMILAQQRRPFGPIRVSLAVAEEQTA